MMPVVMVRAVSSGCCVHVSAVLAPGWQAGAGQRGACLSALPPASTQQQLSPLLRCSICISRKFSRRPAGPIIISLVLAQIVKTAIESSARCCSCLVQRCEPGRVFIKLNFCRVATRSQRPQGIHVSCTCLQGDSPAGFFSVLLQRLPLFEQRCASNPAYSGVAACMLRQGCAPGCPLWLVGARVGRFSTWSPTTCKKVKQTLEHESCCCLHAQTGLRARVPPLACRGSCWAILHVVPYNMQEGQTDA